MARRLYTDYQQIYKILKNHPAMSELLKDFKIEDYNFKDVCMFLTTNYSKIAEYDLKNLYYSQTYSTLEPDQISPYAKRFNKFEDLPIPSTFIENDTVYYVINPLPGAYYKFNSLLMQWVLDASYSEMSVSEYDTYKKLTGHMTWENDSGYFSLIEINGKRSWVKVSRTNPTIKGTVVRIADLPTDISSIGDIYKVSGEDILDILATYYGYAPPTYVPPWDHVMSESGKKLTELLYFTLFYFMYLSVDSFYEKHILDFLPAYDRDQILLQPKTSLFMKSLGKKLDELESYMISLENSFDIDQCPEELLDYLGQNLGYEKEDFTLSNLSFRELLKNIIEIYKVKGTNYSFSFFFKFLGFSINLKEFYFNRDVQNPEAFPGADFNKIEYYLTTKNPIYETKTNVSVSHLNEIKNINDWAPEKIALDSNMCMNTIPYMLGKESYNNEELKWHSNPWKYFKTNLIEYQLSPFLSKVNLTASDNETIKKYVKFLSPTYLFTWINVNILPWIESYEIESETIFTEIISKIGDPRPTPSPWPMFKPGERGVPAHTPGTPFKKKTSMDPGFTGPYIDYEDISTYFYLYNTNLETSIPIYPLSRLEMPDTNGATILQYYDKLPEAYYLKEGIDPTNQNCMLFLRHHGIRFENSAPFRLLRNPMEIYEEDCIYMDGQNRSILDFYNKTSTTYDLKSGLTTYEKSLAKRFMNLIYRIGDMITIDIQNNMNLGGDDIVGTILRRDGSTVRLKEHPSFIVDLKHKAKKRLSFDNLQISIKKLLGLEMSYSSKSYPALPDSASPFLDEILFYSNNVTFNWDECPGAGDYRVQIAKDQRFMNIVEENIVQENYYITQNKLHNDIYYWRMKIKNDTELDLNRVIDRHTFNYYLDRIGKLNGIGQSLFPPTTLSDKSFFQNSFDEYRSQENIVGYLMKSGVDVNRIKDILLYIGYNWSPWTQYSTFDLQVSPFPYDGESIRRDINLENRLNYNSDDLKFHRSETKYLDSIWTQKVDPNTSEITYEYNGSELMFRWPRDTNAEIYELEVNTDPDFGFRLDGTFQFINDRMMINYLTGVKIMSLDGSTTYSINTDYKIYTEDTLVNDVLILKNTVVIPAGSRIELNSSVLVYYVDTKYLKILVSTIIPEFFMSYDSGLGRYYIDENKTYYWRYRIKHLVHGWRDWSNNYSFDISF